MREIYIRKAEGMEIAVMEDGHLVEFLPFDDHSSSEAIYIGRVVRVVPGMKAAFVQIGQEKNGFLPLEEHNAIDLPKLQTGMNVLVQVRKEAQGVKGAFLSREINLCGEYVLFSPMNRLCAISSRISRERDRKRLKELAHAISEDEFGLIMRSASLGASEEQIRAEVEALQERWIEISRAAPTAHVPSILHASRTTLDLVLADYHPRGIDRIFVNDANLVPLLSAYAPVTVTGDNLFDIARISTQLRNALERRVWLKNGGNLVIDPCEAMTVIDVNTAKFTGSKALDDTVLKLNIEACEEIVRQVRLRNLSGIIIIDMIDMMSKEHEQMVLKELNRAFSTDRVKTVVHGFTSLGLVELTRRRSRAPLREVIGKEKHMQEE